MDGGIAEAIRGALEKNHSIVLGARCQVWYSGRAESYLPEGDRIIIIKPDKTLLIHQPSGSHPVNYMKEGSRINLVDEGGLFLHVSHIGDKEFMEIKLHDVLFCNSSALQDGHKILLTGSEKDMSDMIYEQPHVIEPGFRPFSREEHTKYGFIDVFGADNNGTVVVIECKRYAADPSAVTQLRRYVEKIKSAKGIDTCRGIVAAPRITKNAEQMLRDWGFEFRKVHPPKYLERYEAKQMKLHLFGR